MDTQTLKKLLAEVKTPSYIFNFDEFEKRANLVKKYFGEKTSLCFSIKANPFLLGNLPKVFDKIEVCSPGELTICEKIKADPETIIFSGVNKTKESVERAMDDGVGTFTAESILHAELINNAAVERGVRVPLLVRVTGGSQLGMDENDAIDLIKRRDEYKGIEFVGLHFFTGTQNKKPAKIEKELNYCCDFADRLEAETGFVTKRLEYGTGLAVDYFNDNADELEEERLAGVSEKIREVAERFELTIEMGRFFAAPCGYYLTQVMDTKTNCGTNYAIIDGGMNHLKYDGQLQGMQIPKIRLIKAEGNKNSDVKKWSLCGSLCTANDILAREAEFTGLELGDTLVFCRTGAYSAMEGMVVFLSRELPLIATYSETDGLKIERQLMKADVFNTPKID